MFGYQCVINSDVGGNEGTVMANSLPDNITCKAPSQRFPSSFPLYGLLDLSFPNRTHSRDSLAYSLNGNINTAALHDGKLRLRA